MDHLPKWKCKTVKLEDSVEENLNNLGFSGDFLDVIPKVWSIKERTGK
jgi:hypothetical protein